MAANANQLLLLQGYLSTGSAVCCCKQGATQPEQVVIGQSYQPRNNGAHAFTPDLSGRSANGLDLPNEIKPLFNMLNFIVFGMETRLVELSVFFFLGFSRSA